MADFFLYSLSAFLNPSFLANDNLYVCLMHFERNIHFSSKVNWVEFFFWLIVNWSISMFSVRKKITMFSKQIIKMLYWIIIYYIVFVFLWCLSLCRWRTYKNYVTSTSGMSTDWLTAEVKIRNHKKRHQIQHWINPVPHHVHLHHLHPLPRHQTSHAQRPNQAPNPHSSSNSINRHRKLNLMINQHAQMENLRLI